MQVCRCAGAGAGVSTGVVAAAVPVSPYVGNTVLTVIDSGEHV